MYSDKDFQTFWFRYKTEGEPHGISINSFCINQGVPYKQFYAWFKKHAKDTVIPVEIEGAPTDEETDDVEVPPQPASKPKAKKSKGGILITIQTTDGLFVKKGGKQSLRAVLRTLIKIYTFAPNFKFGTK